LALISPEDISSLSTGVWTIMSPTTLNTLSALQLEGSLKFIWIIKPVERTSLLYFLNKGMNSEQLNAIVNSPGYSLLSASVKAATASLSSGSETSATLANLVTDENFAAGGSTANGVLVFSTVMVASLISLF